jgi:predicted NAD-dependent protein-ADP-ribosyltransferase YbiA (DUF1768 family)
MTNEEIDSIKEVVTYDKNCAAWFCSAQDDRWNLSNMSGGMKVYWPLVRCPANEWSSSEQLYQASKYGPNVICLPASNPNADPNVRNRIRADKTPRGAKLTQKCAVKAGLVREDWDVQEIRIKAMLWVLELKLYWNPFVLGNVIENTGEAPIVEISRKDAFWGCMVETSGELKGANVLGKLLMNLRERMQAVRRGEFTNPEGFLIP